MNTGNKPRLPFEEIPPHERHALYGINCYQHTIGYETPMIVVAPFPGKVDVKYANYIKVQPGNAILKTHEPHKMTFDAFCNAITEGCEEDGLKKN